MNHETPPSRREELEARLTALLLGELPDDEAAALREIIEHDAALARLHERLSRTIALVRETAITSEQQSTAPPAPLKLSDERREKLLQHFKTFAPKEFQRPRRSTMVGLLELGVAAALVAIVGALLLPALARSKARAQRFSLASNLGGEPGRGAVATTTGSEVDVLASGNDALKSAQETQPQEFARKYGTQSETLAESVGRRSPPATPGVAEPSKPTQTTIFLPSVGNVAEAPVPLMDAPPASTPLGAFPPPAQTPNSVWANGTAQTFGLSGEPAWTGSLEKSESAHSDSNRFIGSYAYNVPSTSLQPGGLDAENLHNLGRTLTPQEPAAAIALADAQNRQPDDILLREKQGRGYQVQPQSQTLTQQINDPATGLPAPPGGPIPTTAGDIDPATGLPVPLGVLADNKPAAAASSPPMPIIYADATDISKSLETLKHAPSSELAVHNGRQSGPASGGIILPLSVPEGGFAGGGGGGGGGGAGFNYVPGKTESEPLRKEVPQGFQTAQSQLAANDGLGFDASQKNHWPAVTNAVTWSFNSGSISTDTDKLSESEKVPALGDLPLLGALSRSKTSELEAKKEMLGVVGYVNVPITNGVVVANEGSTNNYSFFYNPNSPKGNAGATPTEVANSPIVLPPMPSNAGAELAYYSAGPRPPAAASEPRPLAPPVKAQAMTLAANGETDQKSQPYWEARQNLAELTRFRQILDMKIEQEKIDVSLPKTTTIEIVDTAFPPAEHSPNLWEGIRRAITGTVEAKARVKLERDRSDIAGLSDQTSGSLYDPYFVQTEFETLQSDAVLGRVVKDLDLNAKWGKKEGGQPLDTKEAIKQLKKSLDLRPVRNTSLIEIGVKNENGEEAAKLANAVAQSYIEHRKEQRKELTQGGIASLEERSKEQEQKIQVAQAEVDRLRRDLNISDASPAADVPSTLLSAESLRRAESLHIEGEATVSREETLLNKLKELRTNDFNMLAQALPTITQDSLLNSLVEQRTTAEQKLVALEKEFGSNHSEVLNARSLVEDLHNKITNRVDGIITGLDAKVASERAYLAKLGTNVATDMQADIDHANKSQPYWEARRNLQDLIAQAEKSKRDAPEPKRKRSPSTPADEPQPEVQTTDQTFSTFSLNVSDVSFKLAAASLEKGILPEPASVRSEEFINAFDYRDPEPPPGTPVAFAWERARYPFAQNRDLLRFSIKTAAEGRQPGRPLNIVLLLDTSGSMERADRVRIIHEALRVLAAQLGPQDKFSVVTFARTARLWVDGVPGNEAARVADEAGGITPQGGTNLEEAMNLAYQTALRHYLATGVNRVVLLTDGAANLGNVEPEALKQKAEAHRKQGIALDCFGIGWEGYNDDLLEVLSRNGDGRYGFINTPEEAASGFAGQLAGALHVAASDVKVQVEFNPRRVTAYRQIGYAKHQLTKEQFRDNTVAAAQIGAAESGNALYAIAVNPVGDGPLATVRVRYKVPDTGEIHEHEWAVPYTGNAAPLEESTPAMRLAATASAFSEWLAASPYAADVTPDRLLGYLRGVPEVCGADARPKKLEWMIRQAKSIGGK